MKTRKIISIMAAVCLLIFPLSACTVKSKDPVIASLGRAMSVQLYSVNSVGDSTEYRIYTFPGANPAENAYFKPVTEESRSEFLEYVDDFEQWVDSMRDDSSNDLVLNYRFSRGDIDESDYLYIYDRCGEPIGNGKYLKYEDYTVYFFDSQTTTLYYFHSNI